MLGTYLLAKVQNLQKHLVFNDIQGNQTGLDALIQPRFHVVFGYPINPQWVAFDPQKGRSGLTTPMVVDLAHEAPVKQLRTLR